MEQQKIKVSQDFVYDYLTEHNVNISRLTELMGVSNGLLSLCFGHKLSRHGKPLKLSQTNINKLNDALERIAEEIKNSVITFGSEKTFTNSWGRTYDPATRESILNIGNYFKITPFLLRVLGWKKGKRDMILASPSSKVFGQICLEDVNRINAELLSVAGVLSSYEVVYDEKPVEKSQTTDIKKNKKYVRTRMEQTFEGLPKPWDNTGLDLIERYRLYHDCYHDGILFFRVNNGYTVCQDDSEHLCYLDSSLVPYTDPSTGLTTTWMDTEKFAILMPHCVGTGHRIGVTDMYAR